MSNTALHRSLVAVKTNKSGGAHAQGDVCIEDTANANAVINTTTSAYKNGAVWVCIEPNGVANNATGLYANAGYVPKVNLSASASLGDLFATHTVAKQAARHAAPFAAGDFGMVLGTGTTPAAWLFGAPIQVGSGDIASVIQDWKESVRVATTANITLSGTQTIDGVSVIAGDRVLVKDQTTGANNGIYVCASGAWSRATDMDASSEVTANTAVAVEEGTANGDKIFILTTNNPITLGTTALTWTALSAGGGAPTTAEYVTTASDGTLSAEVAIPGLAGSADRAGVGGAGTSEEYDTATIGLTWSPSTPSVVDSDTTAKSHLYIETVSNTEYFGYKSWSPSGAFDARCKFSLGAEINSAAYSIGLHIADSGRANRLLNQFIWDTATFRYQVRAHTYAAGSYTQRGSTNNPNVDTVYLRITRDGSNNVSFYWSTNGILWTFIATQSFTLTVAEIGFRIGAATASTVRYICDWIRSDV